MLHCWPCYAACLPEAKGACLGKVQTSTPDWERIAAEAARTVPGRGETGVGLPLMMIAIIMCRHTMKDGSRV